MNTKEWPLPIIAMNDSTGRKVKNVDLEREDGSGNPYINGAEYADGTEVPDREIEWMEKTFRRELRQWANAYDEIWTEIRMSTVR